MSVATTAPTMAAMMLVTFWMANWMANSSLRWSGSLCSVMYGAETTWSACWPIDQPAAKRAMRAGTSVTQEPDECHQADHDPRCHDGTAPEPIRRRAGRKGHQRRGDRGHGRDDPDHRGRQAQGRQVEVEVDPVEAQRRARHEGRDQEQPRVAVEPSEGPTSAGSSPRTARPGDRRHGPMMHSVADACAAADARERLASGSDPASPDVSPSSAAHAAGDGVWTWSVSVIPWSEIACRAARGGPCRGGLWSVGRGAAPPSAAAPSPRRRPSPAAGSPTVEVAIGPMPRSATSWSTRTAERSTSSPRTPAARASATATAPRPGHPCCSRMGRRRPRARA